MEQINITYKKPSKFIILTDVAHGKVIINKENIHLCWQNASNSTYTNITTKSEGNILVVFESYNKVCKLLGRSFE